MFFQCLYIWVLALIHNACDKGMFQSHCKKVWPSADIRHFIKVAHCGQRISRQQSSSYFFIKNTGKVLMETKISNKVWLCHWQKIKQSLSECQAICLCWPFLYLTILEPKLFIDRSQKMNKKLNRPSGKPWIFPVSITRRMKHIVFWTLAVTLRVIEKWVKSKCVVYRPHFMVCEFCHMLCIQYTCISVLCCLCLSTLPRTTQTHVCSSLRWPWVSLIKVRALLYLKGKKCDLCVRHHLLCKVKAEHLVLGWFLQKEVTE